MEREREKKEGRRAEREYVIYSLGEGGEGGVPTKRQTLKLTE